MAEWFSCNGACSGSDPTSDTVKVDVALLANVGKENVQPKQAPEKAHEAQKAWEEQKKKEKELKAAEERRQLEEEAQRRREEEDANQRREEEAASERAAADRKRMDHEAALKEREAASRKEREALDVQRAAEVQRLRACEAAEKEEKRQAGEKVAAWCKKNSFVNMTTQKSGFISCMSGSKFPLHTAVTNKDVEMVRLMVLLEVDKGAKNSKGQTAADLATALNKDRSMDAILAYLK